MRIGQMFLIGFDGCSVEREHWLHTAVARDLGGVILFDRNVDGAVQNISSPNQLRDLCAQLQGIATDELLIAVDQEGGMVCRLKERDGFPATMSAAVLGSGTVQQTTLAAATLAKTLANSGINLNLAPVVDLDLNPKNPIIGRYERSFGKDPDQVVCHAQAFIQAHHQQGVACCLKHFPGHGSGGSDSHLGFVDISDDWQEQELEPYKRLIASGYSDAIMTAHLIHYGLEPRGLPATLSPSIIDNILREKLGFDGVVISDDLQMRAITDAYGFKEAVQRAVLAGVDLITVGNNLVRSEDSFTQGVAAVQELLDKGIVTCEHIERSLNRITVLKSKISKFTR